MTEEKTIEKVLYEHLCDYPNCGQKRTNFCTEHSIALNLKPEREQIRADEREKTLKQLIELKNGISTFETLEEHDQFASILDEVRIKGAEDERNKMIEKIEKELPCEFVSGVNFGKVCRIPQRLCKWVIGLDKSEWCGNCKLKDKLKPEESEKENGLGSEVASFKSNSSSENYGE